MRKIFFLSLIFYSFISCQYIEDRLSEEESVEKEYAPLFLGLSHKMTEIEFRDEITNLNSLGKLSEDKFYIPIKDDNLYFKVHRTKNSIRLSYSVLSSVSPKNISYELSEKYISANYKQVSDLIEIFDSKYKEGKYTLPTNINLTNYGLNKTYYRVYQDSSKTVLFGYDINETVYPSPRELEEEISNASFLDNMARHSNNVDEDENCYFGFIILIDYFYKEDFNKLLKKMKSDSIVNVKKHAEILEKRIKIRRKVEENKTKNLNEL